MDTTTTEITNINNADNASHGNAGINWMTTPEIARYFNVSCRTVERMIRDKLIPVVRLRKAVRMDPAEVAKILRQPAKAESERAETTGQLEDQEHEAAEEAVEG